MAWHDRSRVPPPKHELLKDQGQGVIVDEHGSRRMAVIGYRATHNSQTYAAKTDHMIEFRDMTLKHGRVLLPTEDNKGHQFSPKKDETIQRPPDLYDLMSNAKQREIPTSNFKREVYAKDESKGDTNGFSPPSHIVGISTLTATPPVQYETPKTVWSKETSYNTSFPFISQSGNHEHSEKNKAIQIVPSSPAQKTIQDKDEGYAKEKKKGNEFSPPSYMGRNSGMTGTDPVPHETEWNTTIGNNTSFTHPAQPRKYESNEKYKPPVYAPSPTKVQPRKAHGYENTIDSEEAKWRYGGKAIPPTRAYGKEEYTKTIDCVEAARRYNGVLL